LRIAFLLPVLLIAGCGQSPAQKGQEGTAPAAQPDKPGTGKLDRSHAGTPAPQILFEDPAGEPASIADFRGKPVLVNLWATWCGPCVIEMPSLDKMAASNPKLQVLAVSQDMNGRQKVEEFFAKRKFSTLEPYLDSELAMMTSLKVDTLPTTILYDADGREVWRMTGMEDWTGPRAADLIREATAS
jgi:thiol-disulfide isomerase/thioredoxin